MSESAGSAWNECAAAHFDETSPSPLTSLSLASTCTPAKTSYAIGMLRTDEAGTPESLCLTPLSSTVQLRPSFALLDQTDGDSSTKTTPRSTGRSAAGDEAMTDSSLHGADASEGAASEGEGGGASDAGQPVTSVIAPLYQEWVHRPHGSSEPRDSNVSSHEDASRSLANSLQGMSVTPSEHGDGPMGEHMRRRLAENRSHVSSLVGGGSSPFASPALQPNRAPNIPTFGGL